MIPNLRYIGLDVHKETIVIAVADAGAAPRKRGRRFPITCLGW